MSEEKTISNTTIATLDDINAIILVSDQEGKIVFANKAIKEILGYEPEELLGQGWWKLTQSDLEASERKSIAIALAKGESCLDDRHLFENPIITKDGSVVWTQWTNTINTDGFLVGIAQDITQKKTLEQNLIRKNKENELLLKEIHHRVKNNLQIISSMLNLQFGSFDDPAVLESLLKTKDRINSMAIIHTKIYLSEALDSINFDDYLNDLATAIQTSYSGTKTIEIDLIKSGVAFDIDLTINLGLIITELLTNAFKHAFTKKKQGRIKIELKTIDTNKHQLIVEDNGVGIDGTLPLNSQKSLGLEIVDALTEQINGNLDTEFSDGLKYLITFSK
ncbi:MAG: PAS domain S-box-containing protein [Crocinitomicaceae bacterium]|jgi:PAS domain S-box-containing protein